MIIAGLGFKFLLPTPDPSSFWGGAGEGDCTIVLTKGIEEEYYPIFIGVTPQAPKI